MDKRPTSIHQPLTNMSTRTTSGKSPPPAARQRPYSHGSDPHATAREPDTHAHEHTTGAPQRRRATRRPSAEAATPAPRRARPAEFEIYTPTKKGHLHAIIPQCQTNDKAVSVGEIASEVAITSRGATTVRAVRVAQPDPGAGSSSAAVEVDGVIEEELTEDESDAHSSDDDDKDSDEE